ncbi:hypothetical protein MPL1032_340003 [Mesorhizobium plurifarium]|uniref:Uncharacterized protein n=1 Tax=Mesorhizobium plurifarium TaxID=69974 RepID=A0A0K2W408_MESPL|nr:hypothetical protein MPL1032_340003 [Mesorhizobium plurifarium]
MLDIAVMYMKKLTFTICAFSMRFCN